MKNTFLALSLGILAFTSCNSKNGNSETKDNTEEVSTLNQPSEQSSSPISGLLQDYIQMKNALAKDDDKRAATAGENMLHTFKEYDQSSFNEDEKKTFTDIADDAKEHAEHIGANIGNIEHQREHFEMLSKDMYDLVKKFGAGKKIFVDFCPMYNDNKGAKWLSETKEISNPYFGSKMNSCGEVQEELQ